MDTTERFSLWGDVLCPLLTIGGGWIVFLLVVGSFLYLMVDNGMAAGPVYLLPLALGFMVVIPIWIVC